MKNSKVSQHAGYLLKVVQHEMRNTMDRELKNIALTTSQYAVLSLLDEFPEVSNAELARKCFVSPQTMILIVKKLEQRNLIERNGSKTHGRIQIIKLTESGSDILKKAALLVERIEKELFLDLSESELSTLCLLLKKVRIRT